jgi:hypothetical protein
MYHLHGAFPLSGESTELQQAIVGCSEDSSLGPAVQGFAYSDLIRSLTPFLIQDREKDRARGLERAWIQNCNARFSGYFDNSGLVALTTWLDAALQTEAASKTGQKAKEILVMQILPFPEPGSGSENVRTESGPFFQTLSPLQTVMNVRNQVQAGFSQRDFSAFSKRWELDPAYPVRITFVDVSFPKPRSAYSPPLSWHLRASDKAQIEASVAGSREERQTK